MSSLRISVIIPAYNCEKTISQTLKAVLSQSYSGEFEILVVDDGSSDSTAAVIKGFSGIRYLHQENRGPAAARNLGAKNATGDFLCFTDSDCIPEHDWLERLVEAHIQESVPVIAGSYGSVDSRSRVADCIHSEILFRHNHLMPNNPKSLGSYNFGIERKAFENIGGFDLHYRFASGEDNDLSYRLLKANNKIYFEKRAIVRHHHPTQVMKYLFEQFRHGFWRAKLYRDHPSMMKGDDYTFWKDSLEVLLVLLSILLIPFMLIMNTSRNAHFLTFILCLNLIIILTINIYINSRFIKTASNLIFYSFLTFLRAWARTAGFLLGILKFFLLKQA